VDLLSGRATARKREDDGKEKRWDESVKVLPHGRTFAGRIRYPLAEPLDPVVVLDTLGRR
jgi:hypothetical protein